MNSRPGNAALGSVQRDRLSGMDLPALLERLCSAYNIGPLEQHTVVPYGYEDCNVELIADGRRYLAKILAPTRPPNLAARTTTLISHAIRAGVKHPRLLSHARNLKHYNDEFTGVSAVLMDFVDGRTFLEDRRAPTTTQLSEIMRQIALLHTSEHRPEPMPDAWALQNLASLHAATQAYVPHRLQPFLSGLISHLSTAGIERLPRALIHADLTKGNMIVSLAGDISIIDFGVANYLPRIQELAVAAANLMYDHKTTLLDRSEIVRAAYTAHSPLSDLEHQLLPTMAAAAAAMELLGAIYERTFNHNCSAENDYILALGLDGVCSAAETLQV